MKLPNNKEIHETFDRVAREREVYRRQQRKTVIMAACYVAAVVLTAALVFVCVTDI